MSKARDLANAGTALTTVSATELGYLDGVTSAVQTQIDSKITGSSAIAPTIVDAKGDIIAATASDTVARLAVGSNDTVLTADSSTATGLKWATPAAGGMTLLSTTTLSGASTTISSIDQSYVNLVVFVFGVTNATSNGRFKCLPNNTSNITTSFQAEQNATVTTQFNEFIWLNSTNYSNLRTDANNFRTITISNYANTTARKAFSVDGGYVDDNSSNRPFFSSGFITTNSAITSLVFSVTDPGGNLSGGTVLVYGVK
jgi:hypothetical protein